MAEQRHRVALITGGMGGLGEAICVKMAALGYTVVTTYSPGNTKAQAWLDAMKQHGYTFHAYGCDVADFDSCAACVAKVTAEIGPVDVLVNNAGITRDMTFKKMDKASWDAVIRTNLDSAFNMTKQVCDAMLVVCHDAFPPDDCRIAGRRRRAVPVGCRTLDGNAA